MRGYDLLVAAAAQRASDVHLVPGAPPMFRIETHLVPAPNSAQLTSEDVQQFVLPMLNERQRELLSREFCVDFSVEVQNMRYRGNVLLQRNGIEAVFRLIPPTIPTAEEILLPQTVIDFCNLKSGLVLITGSTGSGKSTTLACIIDIMNEHRRGSIITIEDPIEYVHNNKNCIISQREIGMHAPSFRQALRYVMRQDPNVIMVGEMRDLETMSAAITIAETGHLVLATLHSPDSVQAVERMIDVFPAEQQPQIRTQLAGVLRAVVAQFLVPRASGRGLVAVREIMIVNSAVRNLIRTAKTHEIYTAIEMGIREGMVPFPRAIAELASRGLIDSRLLHVYESNITSGQKMSHYQDMSGANPAA